MDIDISSFDEGKRGRLAQIIQLGQALGDNPQIGNALMSSFIDEYLGNNELSEIDKLSNAYQMTEDPTILQTLTQKLQGELGVDPAQSALNEQLMGQFSEEFPTDVANPQENMRLQALVQSNPKLLEQYYANAPKSNSGAFGLAGALAGAGAGAAIGAPFAGVGSIPGSIIGAVLGGLGGGVGGATLGSESSASKKKRLQSLASQYMPSN